MKLEFASSPSALDFPTLALTSVSSQLHCGIQANFTQSVS